MDFLLLHSGVLSFYSIDSLGNLWLKLVLRMVQAALTLVENPRYVMVKNITLCQGSEKGAFV